MIDKDKDYFKFKYSPLAAILSYGSSLGKKKVRRIETLSDLK